MLVVEKGPRFLSFSPLFRSSRSRASRRAADFHGLRARLGQRQLRHLQRT